MAWTRMTRTSPANATSTAGSSFCDVDVSTSTRYISITSARVGTPTGDGRTGFRWTVEGGTNWRAYCTQTIAGNAKTAGVYPQCNTAGATACPRRNNSDMGFHIPDPAAGANCVHNGISHSVSGLTSSSNTVQLYFYCAGSATTPTYTLSVATPQPGNPTATASHSNITFQGATLAHGVSSWGSNAAAGTQTPRYGTGSNYNIAYSNGQVITGLNPSTTYNYRNVVTNNYNLSHTASGSFTTSAFTNPGAPGKPTLSWTGTLTPTSTLTATWTAASAGSTAITGYRLRLYVNDVEKNMVDTGTTGVTKSWNLSSYGVTYGDKIRVGIYSYCTYNSVQYFNGGGTGASQVYSDYVTVPLPPVPTINTPVISDVTASSMKVTVTGSVGSGATLAGYRFAIDGNWGQTISENYFTFTGLAEGTTYTISARIIDNHGQVAESSINATTLSGKFVKVSVSGGAFTTRKMYISINGASFKEVTKTKMKVIK